MLTRVWNFLRGYVIIRVTGFSVERFINLAVHRGVVFINMKHDENEFAEMQVAVRDFWQLKLPAKKTKCKIKILKRVGMPFFMQRYRKRKFLAAGVVFFVAALFMLSSFVWQVNIEGYERVNPAEVTAFLQEIGLGHGASKRSIDVRWFERQLLANFADINWVNVEIRGTVAIVRITETLPGQEIFDYTAPADIVASKDALILGVAATSGVPMVRPGDVVSQGDVLVSGLLSVATPDQVFRQEYVRAEAEITAKIVYSIEVFVPLQYVERNLSGNSRRFRGVQLFGRMFGLGSYNIPYTNFDKDTREWQLGIGPWFPVPFVIHTVEYYEIIVEMARRTEEQAQFHASELIDSRLAEKFGANIEIVDVNVEFHLEEGFVRAQALITTIESIGETVFINNHPAASRHPSEEGN